MKKVLWFSRHQMTGAQQADLEDLFGPVKITQVDRTIDSAFEIKDEVDVSDLVAIVAPISLQGQFLQLAGDRPVLLCRNHRVATGEQGPHGPVYRFEHAGWDQLVKIEFVKTILSEFPKPEEVSRAV